MQERSTTTLEIFSPESLALVKRVEAPIYTRPPATYREDWLESYVPNQSAYLMAKQRKELAALGKRDPICGRARTYIKKIYDRLLIDFSFNSSRLEGNERTARLASIIPLIKGDYVPQSFVEMDPDSYLKATIAVYEFNEVEPLADVYIFSYQRSCHRYDTTAHSVGFDEIAALYRTQRRALVTDLVRARVPPDEVDEWTMANISPHVEPQHRGKFLSDVVAEIKHLDASRIAALGITREEFEAWKRP